MTIILKILYWLKKHKLLAFLFGAAVIGCWMLDHDKVLKETDISPNGVLTYEFADLTLIDKINKAWAKDSVLERTTIFHKIFSSKPPKEISKITIARHSIFIDFIFIVFYVSTIFLLAKKILVKWKIKHYDLIFENTYFRQLLEGEKNHLLLKICIIIGISDAIENIIMLFNLENDLLGFCVILLKIVVVKIKFYLLISLLILILYTILHKLVLILLVKPQIYKEMFLRLFRNKY